MQSVGNIEIGKLSVRTTDNRGMNAEEITDLAMARVMSVSDTAPMPIREQAVAFKDHLRNIIRYFVGQAQRSERTTIEAKLRRAGFHAAANVLKEL